MAYVEYLEREACQVFCGAEISLLKMKSVSLCSLYWMRMFGGFTWIYQIFFYDEFLDLLELCDYISYLIFSFFFFKVCKSFKCFSCTWPMSFSFFSQILVLIKSLFGYFECTFQFTMVGRICGLLQINHWQLERFKAIYVSLFSLIVGSRQRLCSLPSRVYGCLHMECDTV